MYLALTIVCSAAMGDVGGFGSSSFPHYPFSGREISFDVLNDNILEHTEEGELEIAPDPINFAGHTPLFKSLRISIKDDEGKFHT